MPLTVQLQRVGKEYRLGGTPTAYVTLRDEIERWIRGFRRPKEGRQMLWALKDVELEINAGVALGIVGRNGAGKSTLLKILARITRPTTGVARMRGRVGALLEVGTGFHPELTGRENMFLNGAVLGMSRREVKSRFDEIVAFAGVESFLDTPVKRYSSGMRLRLAFAVAAHLESEILLVDEVLAVGDAEFRAKCMGKMSSLGHEGRTVIFISHDLGAIGQLCGRAVWLEKGVIRADGSPSSVIDAYLRYGAQTTAKRDFDIDPIRPVQLRSIALGDEHGARPGGPRRDDPLVVRLRVVTSAAENLDMAVYILNNRGVRVLDEALSDGATRVRTAAYVQQHEISLTIPPLLASGEYVLGAWIGSDAETFLDEEVLTFRIWPRPDDRQESVDRARVVRPLVRWHAETRVLR